MSDDEYQVEDIPFDDDAQQEEVLIESTPTTKPKKEYKRKPTNKQLETMRANLAKGREKRQAMVKANKKQEEQYDEYLLQEPEPQLVRRGAQRKVQYEDEYSDEYTDASDSEPEYEIKKKDKSSKKKDPPTKREVKEQNRLDKIENILMKLVNEQKKSQTVKRHPTKIIKNTVIQIPKSGQSTTNGTGSYQKLIKLF